MKQIIDGKEYELILYPENSAPCSNCIFLKKYTLTCTLKLEERKCKCKPSPIKGWDTWEYRPFVI